ASSPSRRCRVLANALGGAVSMDPRWMEFDFGHWEGRAWHDLPRAEIDAWANDLVSARPPGGESLEDVALRATAVFEHWLDREPERLIVVAHGGVIRVVLAHVLGLPLANCMKLQVDYGSISEVEITESRRVVRYVNH
ncbi:MAG: alpha-ribazole phosphatase, partial [Chromatiales bacterium]|nr:alpha-ribazole phosphatase [Chromatiales bacterium]